MRKQWTKRLKTLIRKKERKRLKHSNRTTNWWTDELAKVKIIEQKNAPRNADDKRIFLEVSIKEQLKRQTKST